jgi:flagella basal body P-ring formation protein FlgA
MTKFALNLITRLTLAGIILFCSSLSFAQTDAAVAADAVTDNTPSLPAASPTADALTVGEEHFVPNPRRLDCAGTLEIQQTAIIPGRLIRIRHVVRWSDADDAAFAPIGDLVIDHFDGIDNRRLTLDEIRTTLNSAGVNLALIRFSGARSCLISRGPDETAPPKDNHEAVQRWIVEGAKAAAATQPATAANDAEGIPFHSLRDRLTTDLADRLTLSVDDLQLNFDPKDKNYLSLAEPAFHFDIQPRRCRDLGAVNWDVTISSGDKDQKLTINANARCWQRQLVMVRAAAYHQVLQAADISQRRALVDSLPADPLLTESQIVGQQAARDLRPGMVLTARLVEPLPLARTGQFVSVTLNRGGISIRTTARAMESGSYGQTIKLKSEDTNDIFQATLTGPQEASVGPPVEPAKLASDKD